MAILMFLLWCPLSFAAVTLVPLLSFDGTNGYFPHCNLVPAKNGVFYGTTSSGSGPESHAGTVFKITSGGQFTVVASFDGTNGGVPWDGLVLGIDGDFYGTARAGGTNNGGTVFKMTPRGKLTVMARFGDTNGSGPDGLVQGVDANFYGITESGGDFSYNGDGTVFRMSPAGELTTLFMFDGTNGTTPWSLVQGHDGNLYGTTLFGGAYEAGTVFQITTNGTFTSLWNCDGTNGGEPASVIQAMDGNLYGTSYAGGQNDNGTIFKLTTNGALTILHSFSQRGFYGENSDGSNPVGKLMEGKDGCLYGGTQMGGSNLFDNGWYGGIGTLFKISTNGDFTTLCSFGLHTNFYETGSFPNGLIQDEKGNFFGTTYLGGLYDVENFGLGTVFKLVTVRPVLAIREAHQGHPATNAVVISGKTKAKVQTAITNVLYQLNAGAWKNATTTNNWTNWTATVTPAAGKNIFFSYALDANGDASRTNVLKLRFPK